MARNYSLDDDDYEVIKENLGIEIPRKRFKRVQPISDDDSGDEEQTKHIISDELFGDADNMEHSQVLQHRVVCSEEFAESSSSEDEFADFIESGKNSHRRDQTDTKSLTEAEEIFGIGFTLNDLATYQNTEKSTDQDLFPQPSKSEARSQLVPLAEIYEPFEIENAELTDLDVEIKTKDIPERFQTRRVPLTPAGMIELNEEAIWIYHEGFSVELNPAIVNQIQQALHFMKNHFHDIPFIAFYRRDALPQLTLNHLWKIYCLDERYCNLKKRKDSILGVLKSVKIEQTESSEHEDSSVRLVTDEDVKYAETIKNELELTDYSVFIRLYYAEKVKDLKSRFKFGQKPPLILEDGELPDSGPKSTQEQEKIFKRRCGNPTYELCKKLGVKKFIEKIGLTAEQFAENVKLHRKHHEVNECLLEPLEAAKEIVSSQLKNELEVLQAAKVMLALEITCNPVIRRCIRKVFFENAAIDVIPTRKGCQQIDENHPCYPMKYLKGKPAKCFRQDQFLHLVLSEEANEVNIRIGENLVRKGETNTYVKEIQNLFYTNAKNLEESEWNKLRNETVHYSLETLLFPVFRKELRLKLIMQANLHVLTCCSHKLYKWLKVAPFNSDNSLKNEFKNVDGESSRVLAIAYEENKQSTSYACLVTENLLKPEYLKLKSVTKNIVKDGKQDTPIYLKSLKSFIFEKKPHVIVIGGESRVALEIKVNLKRVVHDLAQRRGFPVIEVVILDNRLAKVYSNSKQADNDFPHLPSLLKQAISLGRRFISPLQEFSQLCNFDDEILNLRFHSLQDQVPQEELLKNLEFEFIKRTNAVGVDVNLALDSTYHSKLLQFVGGLGKRKANSLLRCLRTKNVRFENRQQLKSVCKFGEIVFANCAGFLKVKVQTLGETFTHGINVLDGSRVHPESYQLATILAIRITNNPDKHIALEIAMGTPEKEEEINLNELCKIFEHHGLFPGRITVREIQKEIHAPYKEHRLPITRPTLESVFYSLTKETLETFRVGKLIMAKVVDFCYKKQESENPAGNPNRQLKIVGVRTHLDNGVSGFIPATLISEDNRKRPEDMFTRGQVIQCRITKIDYNQFSVVCSTRLCDIRDVGGVWKPALDTHYDKEKAELDKKHDITAFLKKQKQAYLKRVIIHNAYKNLAQKDVESLLTTMGQGESIVRPSSKGATRFKLTWKVAEFTYQQVTICELNSGSAFEFGQPLKIGSVEFDNLDEILDRHIHPMASFARELMKHKRFDSTLKGSLKQADKYLNQEYSNTKARLPYLLHISSEYPGKFILSYLSKDKGGLKPKHEFITVTPDGFLFQKKLYLSINQVINYHKTCPSIPSKAQS